MQNTSLFPSPPVYYREPIRSPPLPPADGVYSSFGVERLLDEAPPKLEDLGQVSLLVSTTSPSENLRHLLHEALSR